MNRPPTREEAARALGVSVTADAGTCKQAYRRLAREHHPDVGGDPDRFQLLHRAYERLVAEGGEPSAPTVSRGTPSTPPVPFVDETDVADLGSFDWDAPLPSGRVRLDRDRVAVWLAGSNLSEHAEHSRGTVRHLVASSRSPGAKLNGAAHLLAPELVSRLEVVATVDDRGTPIVAVEVIGRNRRARRALDRVALAGVWVRTRRSTTTQLRTTLRPSDEPQNTAARVTVRLASLLDDLDWPLRSWTLIDP